MLENEEDVKREEIERKEGRSGMGKYVTTVPRFAASKRIGEP
jgi:hypothetical protein